jgi:hypothetical protein
MPRDWEKIAVPFVGEDGTADELAARPNALAVAENVTPGRDGAISPRPGFKAARGAFWTSTVNGLGDAGSYSGAGAENCPFPHRAICSVRAPGEVPLLLCDGRAYHLSTSDTSGTWHDLGSYWSCAVPYLGFAHSAVFFSGDPQTCGVSVSGAGDLHVVFDPDVGFVVHGADGQRLSQFLPTRNPGLGTGDIYHAALGNNPAAVYNTGLGELVLVQVSAADPHAWTETLLATDARTTVGQFQEAVWDPATLRLYVAYLTTTATQIKVMSVTTSLATATTTHTGASGFGSVAIGLVNGRLVVAGGENAGTQDVVTKVFSAAAPPADLGLDVVLAPTGVSAIPRFLVVGPTEVTANAMVAWNCSDSGHLEVVTRSTTAATSSAARTWLGSAGSATTPAMQLTPRYAPFVRNGATLLGVEVGTGQTIQFNTVYRRSWVLLDVTALATNQRYGRLVAQGPVAGSAPQWPSNVSTRRNGEAFISSNDFLSYFTLNSGAVQGETHALRVARLDFDGQIPVAEANGAYLLGGSTTYHYDGVRLVEAGFVHAPEVDAQNVAGGSLPAGDYAIAAIWTWTDALGRKHRSALSNITTLTVAGGATANALITATTTYFSKREYEVEFYMSVANPPASGVFPMYKVAAVEGSYTTGVVQVTVGTVSTTFEQLYDASGTVLENFPAPGSDGGLAAVGERVWAATGRTLAPSKLLANGPPAWNEELQLTLPASGGRVTALLPDGDNLLVFCERAVYRVGGAGPDDTFNGPPFPEPVLLTDVGCTGPAAVARTPIGAVFQGADHQLYLMSGGLTRLSVAVDRGDFPLAAARAALVHHPKTDSLVVVQNDPASFGRHLVWNYRNGQWARWAVQDDAEDVVLSGSGALVDGHVWLGPSRNSTAHVGRFDPTLNQDEFASPVQFTCTAETQWIRLNERARGWARCGAVTLFGECLGTSSVTVQVHRDHVRLASPESHTFTANPAAPVTTFPVDRFAPEIRLARLKASAVKVVVSFTRLKLVELELDVRRAGPHAPPGQRVP